MAFEVDDLEIPSLNGVVEINEKIKAVSNEIPEHSKIFFHIILATDLNG